MADYIDKKFIKKGKIEKREYQRELVKSISKKGSSLIVAPTALGKTIVAALAIANVLKDKPKGRVMFLTPTKPLAEQHKKTLMDVMDLEPEDFITLTGKIKPSQRYVEWKNKKIVTATPETVRNDVLNHKIPLEDFSLVIFDEAHRAVKDYAYVLIANEYNNENEDGIVLALTASPGSSKKKIERVCSNLGIDNVEIKTEKDSDVEPYVHERDMKWIRVSLPEELKKVKKILHGYMEKRYSKLKEYGFISNYDVEKTSTKRLLNLQKKLGKIKDSDKRAYPALSYVAGLMKIHHALELLETQGVTPAMKYMERLKRDKTKAGKRISKDPEIQRALVTFYEMKDKGKEHPKLPRAVEEVKERVKEGKKILLFSQYRDTVQELVERLKDEGIRTRKFIGQTHKRGERGLSQEEQKQILKNFRSGDYDVLVCTQIAEEGLDIPSVDTVMFYEPVPSEIRHIQRKGRTGRKQAGEVVILMTENTRDEAYYWVSKNKEKKMKKMLKNWDKGKSRKEKKKNKDEAQKTLSKFSGKRDVPMIYADNREASSGIINELKDLGAEVREKNLKVGDFLVSERVVIERKTGKDFANSIIDKRMFQQAQELKENFENPLIVIEGNHGTHRNIHPNAIRGALCSLAVDFEVPIIYTEDTGDTAALIYQMAKREQLKKNKGVRLRGKKTPKTLKGQQVHMVQSLPGIGPNLAHELLKKFRTIKEIANADKQKLTSVEGVGEKKAKEIKKIFTKKWKEEKPQ